MGNMSYCRFENTSSDLLDCMEALEDLDVGQVFEMSSYEREGLLDLVKLSNEISNQFSLEDIQDLVDEAEQLDNEE
tara:strand:+ start:685 stop:912 length:228 start_codon:yes stop_codon:yes gene_type:complete